MKLRPLGNTFLFSFFAESYGGQFVERSRSSIILTNQDLDHQAKYAKWAKVIAIGDKVSSFDVGDIVLIEALKWTVKMKFDEVSYWKSDEEKVIAIGDDESVTYID